MASAAERYTGAGLGVTGRDAMGIESDTPTPSPLNRGYARRIGLV